MTVVGGRGATRAAALSGSLIDDSTAIISSYQHEMIRFAMGSPAPEMIPAAAFAEAAQATMSDPAAYAYGETPGEPRLRTAIVNTQPNAQRSNDERRILVTAGGMQGLDLACKLFVEPGALVVCEAPTYPNGIATIRSYEGEVLPIRTDADGLVPDDLERAVHDAGRLPSVLYLIPNFQNPSGVTLSLERRQRILELARRWDATIIEDDPYGSLRFEGDDLPSLSDLADRPDRVVRVETFSKILAPGLRVGWVDADPVIIDRMVKAKQGMDTCTNVPAQRLVTAFLEGGHLDQHVERLRVEYRRRRDDMQRALASTFAHDGVRWTHPSGGMFLWLTLPDGERAEELFTPALEAGVAFMPGSAFAADHGFANALRLCFTAEGAQRTELGLQRLRSVLAERYPHHYA